MRTRSITVLLSAAALTAAVNINAQTPTNPQRPDPQAPRTPPQTDRQRPATDPQRPMTDTQRSTTAGQVVVIAGCLKEERDAAGAKPGVAERAGIGEDYVLTNVKMASSSKVSGIALADTYDIQGITKDDLKKHLNHQVEITGTIGDATPNANDETPDFNGTSLKMVSATCTAQ